MPKFLSSFAFQSNTKDDAFFLAIDTIRQMYTNKKKKLPTDTTLDFLTDNWKFYVICHDGKFSKRYYDLYTIWELRINLRAGNVLVKNSRSYANHETYLIQKYRLQQLRTEVCKQINVHKN